jgi:hypothetical protein
MTNKVSPFSGEPGMWTLCRACAEKAGFRPKPIGNSPAVCAAPVNRRAHVWYGNEVQLYTREGKDAESTRQGPA